MYTDLQIINLGLAKITASRVVQIAPPRTALEVFCSEGYTAWKRGELAKRRWVFALEDDYPMTLADTLTYSADGRKYKFDIPTEALRPVRQRYTEWKQRGRSLYSSQNELKVQLIMNVPEADFDPLFVDVLACRIAQECVEFATQSAQKAERRDYGYKEAVSIAAKANAFVIGPEDIGADDNDFSFLTERYYPNA